MPPTLPRSTRLRHALLGACAALAAAGALADAPADEEATQARGQVTWVRQAKPAFPAAYSGPNSLVPAAEQTYSLTATAMLGARVWRGGEVYLNPEAALGVPLSNLTGLGGFPNGELARTSGKDPTFYLARAFLRQTWSLGGGTETVESDLNQLGGRQDRRRIVLTVGKMSVIDVFDDNAYSHDARTQFLNWSLVTHGAYDFAANARGYSLGAALEWHHDDWALRIGRFAMPTESNGTRLDTSLQDRHGDQVELERGIEVAGEPGRVRLLAYRNRAVMADYRDALELAAATGGTPALAPVRREQARTGFGVNLEQRFGGWGGAFFRASRTLGDRETFAYTEIDRSVSGGVLLDGTTWGRSPDRIGLAMARNGLNAAHREYLAAGGLGFFIGDGALRYRPEQIVEAFYAWQPTFALQFALDVQWVSPPAYNADRGPVRIYGLRMQAAF
jgi:high affinity Mn2+ porin